MLTFASTTKLWDFRLTKLWLRHFLGIRAVIETKFFCVVNLDCPFHLLRA